MAHHCAGCSTTAGMAGCPEHGGHSWSSSQPVLTHCQHGLDLRINPRCYLCEPAANPAPLDAPVRGALARAWKRRAKMYRGLWSRQLREFHDWRTALRAAGISEMVDMNPDAIRLTVTVPREKRINEMVEERIAAIALATPAPLDVREWAKAVVRSVPPVHIENTDAVPTFKRRPDQCIDRAAVLLALEHATPAPLDVLTEPMLTKALGEVAKVTGGALLAGGVKHRIGLSFAILEQLGSVTLAATPAPLDVWQQGYDAGYKEGQEDANLIAPTPLAPGPRAIVDGCICQKCADRGDECDYGAEPNHDECSLCERGRHVRERDREDEMEQES